MRYKPGDRPATPLFTNVAEGFHGYTHLYLFALFSLPASAAIINDKNLIPPVIVKARQTLPSLTAGAKSIITREEMLSTGNNSFTQALQNLAGVELQDITGTNSQVMINMRGFGANATSNTLLLLNGIPLANPDMAPPDLNAIPVQDIEYIEVIAGSESVLYGDQAVGGIINVITRTKAKEHASLTCHAGSYRLRQCDATWLQHYRQLRFDVTASSLHTDNYREHNDYNQHSLFGKFIFPYTKGNFDFYYKFARENMQFPGALTAAEVRQNRRQSTNSTDFFHDSNGFLHLKHQHYLTDSWQIETDIARRNMNGNGVLFLPFTQSRLIYYIRPAIKGSIAHTLVTTGLALQTDQYHLNSPFGQNDDTQQKYGLFGIINYPVNEKYMIAAGARGALLSSQLVSSNQLHLINRALATTLGMTYQYTNDVQFYLRRASSFRFPKADENNATPTGIIGLRTQRGIAYEAGTQVMKENYSVKFNLYQLRLRDEIAFDPTQTPQDPFGSNRNLAPTMRYGFSLSGKRNISDQISLNAQYNYVNARLKTGIDAGNRIPLVSENIIRGGLQYKPFDQFSLYPEVVFTGNQYAANDDANSAGKIGGYTVYHFNLNYTGKNMTASLRFNNITNKYYYFYTVYQPGMASESFYPAPGRNVNLTLTYLLS